MCGVLTSCLIKFEAALKAFLSHRSTIMKNI